MAGDAVSARSRLPSVDAVLRDASCEALLRTYGRTAGVEAIRCALEDMRSNRAHVAEVGVEAVVLAASAHLERKSASKLKRVFNLTGTVIHTNLGRSILPQSAVDRVIDALRYPLSLEFELDSGKRGERDDIVRGLLREITGAEDVCVVNNNAAAVLLVLSALAGGKQTIVSRGELIEIGGSFRMPDIMVSAGTRLVEVGTTNRTHLKDYDAACGPATALLMKVHTSNYLIQGFTAEVSTRDLVTLGRAKKVPVVDDLGSGTLVDLAQYGLRRERTVQDALSDGADLVTFSGDKLLGGPQAGFIAGRKDLVRRCAKHPIKRAMRLDKIRLAALEATLQLYRHPERLHEDLPTLRFLTRPLEEIAVQAEGLRNTVTEAVGSDFVVAVCDCASQIGSGALPLETLSSAGISIKPKDAKASGSPLLDLAAKLRRLDIPVIGHIADGALVLDLRCLDDEAAFRANLSALSSPVLGAAQAAE